MAAVLTEKRRRRLLAVGGVVVGSLCAVLALSSWRVSDRRATTGAQVRVSVNRSGPLGVSPTGPVLSVADLRAGSRASGRTTVRNLTNRRVVMRIRLTESTNELDPFLGLEVIAGEQIVFHGMTADLRNWTRGGPVLGPNETRAVEVRAELSRGLPRGHQGRMLDAELELATRPVSRA